MGRVVPQRSLLSASFFGHGPCPAFGSLLLFLGLGSSLSSSSEMHSPHSLLVPSPPRERFFLLPFFFPFRRKRPMSRNDVGGALSFVSLTILLFLDVQSEKAVRRRLVGHVGPARCDLARWMFLLVSSRAS